MWGVARLLWSRGRLCGGGFRRGGGGVVGVVGLVCVGRLLLVGLVGGLGVLCGLVFVGGVGVGLEAGGFEWLSYCEVVSSSPRVAHYSRLVLFHVNLKVVKIS